MIPRRIPPISRTRIALASAAAAALLIGGAVVAVAATGGTGTRATAGTHATAGTPAKSATASQYTFIHDPSMAQEDGAYYVFSTGDPAGVIGNGNIQIRTSRNLRDWTYTGTVFAAKPAWITSALGAIPNLWAPDISYFGGLWHLYYAGSSFGSNNSVIGLATTPTLNPSSPKYHWTDDGLVFQSTSTDDYNAIDPSLVTAANGAKWLVFGSYWSGIKLIGLDPATGKPATSPPVIDSLAAKPFPDPEEGAGIVYHGGYYYLFVAVDTCCRGISSTYHIQVGRSASITGPYVDAFGTALLSGGGLEVQGTDAGMIGPGSPFVFAGRGDQNRSDQNWLVYHYYDAYDSGAAWLQIRPLAWVDGWPVTGDPLVSVPGEAGPPRG
jgi:arabinan endo-1,5-alpha-L-arabinosidase